ncbi:hypothetical protein V1519DRAFT_456170 [Lipomyces tetrasporus]
MLRLMRLDYIRISLGFVPTPLPAWGILLMTLQPLRLLQLRASKKLEPIVQCTMSLITLMCCGMRLTLVRHIFSPTFALSYQSLSNPTVFLKKQMLLI